MAKGKEPYQTGWRKIKKTNDGRYQFLGTDKCCVEAHLDSKLRKEVERLDEFIKQFYAMLDAQKIKSLDLESVKVSFTFSK